MKTGTFLPADILLPKNSSLPPWSVVACDQYTSQADYWQRVENTVGLAPSTLRLILPESCLDGPNVETDIMAVNSAMSEYLRKDIFTTHPDSMVLVRRKLTNGSVREGIVGMVDLEAYDYAAQSSSPIRATEGTVFSRVPPRVAVRKNAPMELTHVILLADDSQNLIFDGLDANKLEQVYDFSLMEEGGQVTGWLLGEQEKDQVAQAVARLGDSSYFSQRYLVPSDTPVLQFAVGDGNHSLATAKECYERQKTITNPEDWANLPARYALVELVNIHQPGVDFQPIHRVLFGVNPQEFLGDFQKYLDKLPENDLKPQEFHYCFGVIRGYLTANHPVGPLELTTLQPFIDQWMEKHPNASQDYIHGADVVEELSKNPNRLGLLLPSMDKFALFPTVLQHGSLPRKTFSLGEANHKRFYLEARKIR